MRKKTHDEYVTELAIKNPTVEVIGTYVNAKTKIMHHCLIHDVYWLAAPDDILHGSGCKECRTDKIGIAHKKTHEQYIREVSVINNNLVVLSEYKGKNTPILHKCLKHNVEWYAMPTNILKGEGCYKCKCEKISNKKSKLHDQYISEVAKVNPDICVLGTYINARTAILHKCLVDGYEWYAIPDSILHGYGCPQCNESSGERQVRQWLVEHNINYKFQKSFDDCRDKNPLPFDFYLPKYNSCIEYDGRQHYAVIDWFNNEEKFKLIQKHDRIKNDYCKNNDIKLLRIPYYANVEEELNNFLFI